MDQEAFKKSKLFFDWADGMRFVLRRCRRSDQAHFDFYIGMSKNVGSALKQARKRYRQSDDAELHVTISHKRRRLLNAEKQLKASAGREYIEVPAGVDPGFRCFVGTKLVGCATGSRFVNSARYTVEAIGEAITMKDDLDGSTFQCTPEILSKHALLAWAVTYNKLQGSTHEGTLCLHLDSKNLQRHHLYVGLSRATCGDNVFLA